MKYLEVFEIVIIYKVCSAYNICDTVTLVLEIIPNVDIPFCTPKIPTFLTELHSCYFFALKYSYFQVCETCHFMANHTGAQAHAIHNFREYVARHTLCLHRLDLG